MNLYRIFLCIFFITVVISGCDENPQSGYGDPIFPFKGIGEVYEITDFKKNNNSISFSGMVLADYPIVLVERGSSNIAK